MKMLSRGMMLALVLLALSQISAAAVSVEYCQVNWTVPRWTPDDTGSHYGVIQFKLGNGPLDAKTVFFFGGHRHLIIRTPLYFIVAMAVAGGSILASAYRALTERCAAAT